VPSGGASESRLQSSSDLRPSVASVTASTAWSDVHLTLIEAQSCADCTSGHGTGMPTPHAVKSILRHPSDVEQYSKETHRKVIVRAGTIVEDERVEW